MIPVIAKRLSETFYENLVEKEGVLKKPPISLDSCVEWLSILSNVLKTLEDLYERHATIVRVREDEC